MFQLGYIEIFVTDLSRARAFYVETLGFELVAVQGEDFVWVKSGAQEMLLRHGTGTPTAHDYQHAPNALVLYSDNLPAGKARLEQRGVVFRGDDMGSPTFTDPDGHWFQLAAPSS